MSIYLKPSDRPTPERVTPTPEQVKAAAKARTLGEIQRLIDAAYLTLFGRPGVQITPQTLSQTATMPVPVIGVLKKIGVLIWANPYELTVPEVFAELGTSAGALFLLANKLTEISAAIGDQAPSIVPAEWDGKYTINADGSVTINA